MAQTGYTPILIYSSTTASSAPTSGNLINNNSGSELAINVADGKLFYKDTSNAVQVIAWKTTPTTAGGTGLTSYTQGDLLYYNSGTTLTKLAKSATATRYLSNTGTNNNPAWAQIDLTNGVTGVLPPANGGTGLSSFTANGIVFADTASTLATGANLAYNSSNQFLTLNGSFGRNAPVTKTADFTLAATENWVINNKSGSGCVVTLPTASSYTGREVTFKNTQAQTLTSASSNVVPVAGGAAGTAILSATAGAWATLVSDGTNWIVMAGS